MVNTVMLNKTQATKGESSGLKANLWSVHTPFNIIYIMRTKFEVLTFGKTLIKRFISV
ncbi:hypothetical protein VISI1226_20784 [Vibrio sinaloensis DSM 21326]|uniref:Uncharacterized protein n=1 Tax=Vibrio sinaloensis DSM 21326 TaxID=945550 RepID=E8MAN8_PHOS4|nr:hypothetical protein VISI1226_20784 [Vibrio sinaloensis DSM 21326]